MGEEEEESGEESGGEESGGEEGEEEVVVAKPVKSKRSLKPKGKKKDPNKPKRNMSAFFLFSTANRAALKEANPDLSFGDLAKLISQKYKGLDDKARKKWDKKAAK